jgi:hypothetical protein
MYWLNMPKFPVNVYGGAGSAAGAVCADTVNGRESAAETAEASNRLRLRIAIPFQKVEETTNEQSVSTACARLAL